jgi:uncharacterized protein (TIGR02466 family)
MTVINLSPIPVYHAETGYAVTSNDIKTCQEFSLQNNDFNYFSNDFNILEDEKLSEISAIIHAHIRKYQLEICGMELQNFYITDSWIALTPPGGKHVIHNHPNAILSGTFYINVPNNSALLFYSEVEMFRNFKFWFDYSKETDYNKTAHRVPVQNSDIVIFPSWLNHGVEVNQSTEDRIVIGFNCFVKGNFGNNRYPTRLTI